MHVKVKVGREVAALHREVGNELARRLPDLASGRHRFFFGNRSVPAQMIDTVRWVSEMIPESPEVLHTRNIILSALNDSESILGTSGLVCVTLLAEALRLPGQSYKEIRNTVLSDCLSITRLSRRSSSDQARSIVRCLDRDADSVSLALRAIGMSPGNGSIDLKVTAGKTNVERVSGYRARASIPPVFLSSSEGYFRRTVRSPRVLAIDGIVENMSEIDGVVSKSYETREPMIIFARGYNDDVQNTLGINVKHGHLVVAPFVVPFDEVGANLLGDLCVISNANLVSSSKGDLISSCKWNDMPCIDEVSVTPDNQEVIVRNDRTRSTVRSHRRKLRSKCMESSLDMERTILESRLSSLIDSGVEVQLGSDLGDLRGLYWDRLGAQIRAYRSSIKHGVVDLRQAKSNLSPGLTRLVISRLCNVTQFLPAASLAVGMRTALSCVDSLQTIGGIIYGDRQT